MRQRPDEQRREGCYNVRRFKWDEEAKDKPNKNNNSYSINPKGWSEEFWGLY